MNFSAYTVSDIATLIGKKSVLTNPEQLIQQIAFDSRKITNPAHSAFFVLKGKNNAHQYIPSLYQSGVRCFVCYQEDLDHSAFPEANFIWAEDTLSALQQLSAHHRQKFQYPLIAITGSNGKTMVKEWLFQLLSDEFKIVRSPKSYNSQIGVPLSLWQLQNHHDLAIIEAGISQKGEMQKLEAIIQPQIGIFTNIGESHNEGFNDQEEKINEKFLLFKNVHKLICNIKYQTYLSNQQTQVFTWSYPDQQSAATLNITEIVKNEGSTLIKGRFEQKEEFITIPFHDRASIENAITCWTTMLALGIQQETIDWKMSRLLPVKMRLELKSGINQTSVIDDSYNSDFLSLEIALDFLNQQNQHQKRTLILSDIQQSGLQKENLYDNVSKLLINKNINRFIGIGSDLKKYQHFFPAGSLFFDHTSDFIEQFNVNDFGNETILIKGARGFRFENISKLLTQKIHETVLEINLNAMQHNFNFYKSKLKPGVKLMAMVKAFGYGSGSYEIANLLQFNHADYLAVAYADEGIALRQAGIKLPIMVMSPELNTFENLVEHRLEPEVFSFKALHLLNSYLKSAEISAYPVHLKLDTGMHRLGFEPQDVNLLADFINQNKTMQIRSVFSHLVASENSKHDDFTLEQIQKFESFCLQLEEKIGYRFIKHICNTSGIRRWPEAQFDMVRLGIGLYGIDNLSKDDGNLEQVATLKTTISQIKHLKKGETVGYGRMGVMPHDGKIATVKIGYADGFHRGLGNGRGSMFIRDQEVFTIGNICMDMCMLDVTGINVNEGDEVVVFGSQQSLYQIAEKLQTIPYEVLTGISQRVKRVYYYE